MGPSAVLVLLGAWVTPAPDTIEARWAAPAGCPDGAALLARAGTRIGDAPHPPATIDGRVRASASGYALELELTIDGSVPVRRELEASTCDELVDAAALIVAVALDPVFVAADPAIEVAVVAHAGHPPAAPSSSATTVARPVAPAAAREEPSARRPTLRALGLALRPSVGAWFGAMPRTALAIGFDVVIPARRSLRAELGVLAIPRQRVDVAPDAGAQLWLATAVVRACFAPAVGRVRPMGCAGFAAGAMGGHGVGDEVRTANATQAWVSATAAAGLTIALARRVELFARAEGHVHVVRPGFHLEAVGSVHRVGATSVVALGGLQVVLP